MLYFMLRCVYLELFYCDDVHFWILDEQLVKTKMTTESREKIINTQ
jgi:hypothetical protein